MSCHPGTARHKRTNLDDPAIVLEAQHVAGHVSDVTRWVVYSVDEGVARWATSTEAAAAQRQRQRHWLRPLVEFVQSDFGVVASARWRHDEHVRPNDESYVSDGHSRHSTISLKNRISLKYLLGFRDSADVCAVTMADLETAASKPLVAPGRLRRPQLFLIFGALSFVWLGALMWMMHGMHNGGEHLEEQMDFAGADIDSLYGVEDAVKCRIACEEHPRCLAFTYVKTDKACWLKGQGYSAKSNPNTISGSINETLKIARLSALNHSHDGRRAHGQRWRSSNEGEDVPEYEDDAQEEGDDSEGGLEGGLEDGSDYTGFTEQSTERSPVVLTDEDVERYNDSTTFLGDVRLLVDVSIPVECEEHCLAHGRVMRARSGGATVGRRSRRSRGGGARSLRRHSVVVVVVSRARQPR